MVEQLRRNLLPAIILTLINCYILFWFVVKGEVLHGIGYFLFFHAAIFIIYRFPLPAIPKNANPVKQPKQELLVTVALTFIGLLAISGNFYLRYTGETYSPLIRLPILFLMVMCTFPVGLGIYLLFKRYKLPALGLRFKPWQILLLGVIIWGVTGVFSGLFHYEGWLWKAGYEELGGIVGLFLQGIIGAALAEEFFRFVLQTRLNQFIKNPFTCILIASTIWAFYHFPVTVFKNQDIVSTTNYCIQIIPLGFVWSCLIHRTRSIMPSILAHGLNLWGFQNG